MLCRLRRQPTSMIWFVVCPAGKVKGCQWIPCEVDEICRKTVMLSNGVCIRLLLDPTEKLELDCVGLLHQIRQILLQSAKSGVVDRIFCLGATPALWFDT